MLIRGDGISLPPLRGLLLVIVRLLARPLPPLLEELRSKSAGLAGLAASISLCHGLLLGSVALSPVLSLAALLSLRRSRMPRALGSRFACVLARLPTATGADIAWAAEDGVADELESASRMLRLAGADWMFTVFSVLVSICRPLAAGDLDLFLASSSTQPAGVGGIGSSVEACRGGRSLVSLLVREELPSEPDQDRSDALLALTDRDPPGGGGPGGGGGRGMPGSQLAAFEGDRLCSRLRAAAAEDIADRPMSPVETALLALGGMPVMSGVRGCSATTPTLPGGW